MATAPEMWEWDERGNTQPFCLEARCALWDGTRCAIRSVAANTKPRLGRLQVK